VIRPIFIRRCKDSAFSGTTKQIYLLFFYLPFTI